MADEPKQQKSAIVVLKEQIDQRETEFTRALPAHMPVERFTRVILTAVQNNAALLRADRQSFFNACMRAAQDGLLPDGREGAIVIYRTKKKTDGREEWIDAAQWMPMVFGILKKIRNSGELASITARVVYGGDNFRYWIDDAGEHVLYEPADKADTSIIRRAFAVAKTKGGELYVETMTMEEIEKVRSVSRSKDKGPWVDWFDQMAIKTVIRRLAKRLPMSSDLDDLVRRDDTLYDLEAASDRQVRVTRPRLGNALDQLAAGGRAVPAIEHQPSVPFDAGTGEVREAEPADRSEPQAKAEPKRQQRQAPKQDREPEQRRSEDAGDGRDADDSRYTGDPGPEDDFPGDRQTTARDFAREVDEEADAEAGDSREQSPVDIAYDRGWRAYRDGMSRKALPPEFREKARDSEAQGWLRGFDDAIEGGKAVRE